MTESRLGFISEARSKFTDEEVAYMERVAGVPWPACLVKYMTYRDDGSGVLKPRFKTVAERFQPNKVRARHAAPVDLGYIVQRVKSMAIVGVKRELAAAEEKYRELRDAARYRQQFMDRLEDA